VDYAGRPGISPALAYLIAAGLVRRHQRILDVGCGTGTDLLLLATWGFRHLDGVDPNAGAIATARRRAARRRLGRRVRFHHVAAEDVDGHFAARTFDVVLHTLVANNLGRATSRHFEMIARVLKPDGLLVLHERVVARSENSAPGRVAPLAGLERHFHLSPGVATHLAEYAGPGYARVVLWLGHPRKRRSRA
jgi:SAM-dependent methyltransferase